jgi:hypothetical protein
MPDLGLNQHLVLLLSFRDRSGLSLAHVFTVLISWRIAIYTLTKMILLFNTNHYLLNSPLLLCFGIQLIIYMR